MSQSINMLHVVVIGAGVIGLQTALTLLEAGYDVTIVAKHWPGDESIEYCSPWAGAIWRTHASPDTETSRWDLVSYKVGLQIIEQDPEKAKEMGIKRCPITIFSNDGPLWYAGMMQNFTVLEQSQLPAGTSTHGYSFTAFAINPLTYLDYLLSQVKEQGARLVTAGLSDLRSFLFNINKVLSNDVQPPNLIINCTGLSARQFCNDEAMYPIRGQTLLARLSPAPGQEILLWEGDGQVTYVVPRPGTDTFVLGGTKTADAYDAEPVADISRGIEERCKKLLGNETQVQVLAEQVGLRPGRRGGPRVELEEIVDCGKKWTVVHNYGHAGGGFQGSMGSAHRVLELVQEAFPR